MLLIEVVISKAVATDARDFAVAVVVVVAAVVGLEGRCEVHEPGLLGPRGAPSRTSNGFRLVAPVEAAPGVRLALVVTASCQAFGTRVGCRAKATQVRNALGCNTGGLATSPESLERNEIKRDACRVKASLVWLFAN